MTDSDGIYGLLLTGSVGIVNVNVCVCVGFSKFWRKMILSYRVESWIPGNYCNML